MDAVPRVKTGLLAIERQRNGQVATRGIAAKDGLCRIVLGKGIVLISQHHCLDVLVGDDFAVVLDFVGLAGERHNHVLALLDHGFQGGTVGLVILAHLDDDGVEVSVVQLLGQRAGGTCLGEVKAFYLGIVGTAAGERRCRTVLVADGGHSDAAALQVVNGQNVVVVLDDGDAAGRELTLEHSSLLRVHVTDQVGRIHSLGSGEVKRILVAQDLLAALINYLLGNGTAGHGTLHRSNLIADVLGHEQHVVAGQQGIDTCRALQHLGCSLHVQRIGKDQAIEAHLATQERVHTVS